MIERTLSRQWWLVPSALFTFAFVYLSSIMWLRNELTKDGSDSFRGDVSSSRPRIVLHVGPGKTATTSLQVEWTTARYRRCLKEDKFWYAGRYYNNTNVQTAREGQATFSPLLQTLRGVMIPQRAWHHTEETYCTDRDCSWERFSRLLQEGHSDRHVLISDEPLALRWTVESFRRLNDIRPLKVIIGYRRLYEWLPDSIYQRNRKRLRDKHWPSPGELLALEPLWPDVWAEWQRFHYTFLDRLVEAAQSAGVSYSVLNLHNSGHSLQHQLFCDSLSETKHCCLETQAADMRIHWNARTTEVSRMIQFDTLSTAAAAKGLINTSKYSRVQVRAALESTDLRMHMFCPDRKQLKEFLEISIQLERTFVGAGTEQEHREGFRKRVEDGLFCQIDTQRTMLDPSVNDFFAQFSA